MPDLMQKQPEDSRSKWSNVGARLTATQGSTFDWREEGAQVNGIAPKATALGSAATGIKHRQRRVVGKQFARRQHRVEHQLVEWRQPPAGTPNPIAER